MRPYFLLLNAVMPTSPVTLRIDFVSDVVCPWCAIGLHALEQAAAQLADGVQLDWHFQPFELNPGMAQQGRDIREYLRDKYGMTDAQFAHNHAVIAERGAQLGFRFDMDKRTRTYNSFAAHRLLHWLGQEGQPGQQKALKHALLAAYFTEGLNISDPAVLLALVRAQGLDVARAQALLASDEYASALAQQLAYWRELGINSVPAVVVNQRHVIQGGQPVAVFVQALQQIASESIAASAE